MAMIRNPILRGFNPDPSIIRVGEDYYIATSTFEWFPGVQIHHSRDLVHWKLVARPLNRVSQLDLKGNVSSSGVWAPNLSYCGGIFYLIYTDVKTFDLCSTFLDTHNYMVTTGDICGDWSEPVFLNSRGYDPSLFHDEDGRKWLAGITWDHRKGKKRYSGITIQEYCEKSQKLIGPVYDVFEGTELDVTEGPNLYKRGGWYYLITAEGGTGYGHAVTLARSRSIAGPYEVDPQNPMLTSAGNEALELKKAGHASLVETQNGEWYMTHLCGRPLPSLTRCTLGRETAIQKVNWTEDGWLRLAHGGNAPAAEVPGPGLPEHPWDEEPVRDDFDNDKLSIQFQSLRIPLGEDMLSLKERPGFLRLKGRESLGSTHYQSLIARRQQAFCFTASACLEFKPEDFRQMAGLILIYDAINYYYLHVTYDVNLGKCINILKRDNGRQDFPINDGISLKGTERCHMRARVQYERLQFFYSLDGVNWVEIGPEFDASTLSDEYYEEIGQMRFTGAFVGLCCQDLTGFRFNADFDWFEYEENR